MTAGRERGAAERVRAAIEDASRIFPFTYLLEDPGTHEFVGGLVAGRLLPGGGRILDIGAGLCDKTAVLAQLGYQCECCDDLDDAFHQQEGVREKILEFAERLGIKYHVGTAQSCQLKEESFDLVLLTSVIEHLHDSPRELLNEAIRVLRPGGVLLLTTPNAANLRKRLSLTRGRTVYTPARAFFDSRGIWRGHVREWTPSELGQLLSWMGLADARVETYHGMLKRKLRRRTQRLLYRAVTSMFPDLRDSVCAWGTRPDRWRPARPPEQFHGPVATRRVAESD